MIYRLMDEGIMTVLAILSQISIRLPSLASKEWAFASKMRVTHLCRHEMYLSGILPGSYSEATFGWISCNNQLNQFNQYHHSFQMLRES